MDLNDEGSPENMGYISTKIEYSTLGYHAIKGNAHLGLFQTEELAVAAIENSLNYPEVAIVRAGNYYPDYSQGSREYGEQIAILDPW